MSNCHSCHYKRNIAGDCHVSCSRISQEQGLLLSFAIMAGNFNILEDVMGISFNPHGVASGWCSFPINFDPAWVEGNCKEFIDRNEQEKINLINIDNEVEA